MMGTCGCIHGKNQSYFLQNGSKVEERVKRTWAHVFVHLKESKYRGWDGYDDHEKAATLGVCLGSGPETVPLVQELGSRK